MTTGGRSVDVAFQRRVLSIFEDACDWPDADRDARLAHLLAAEPATLDAVRAMLASQDQARALLPTIPPEPTEPIDDQPPPERIGPYRLIGELGRGGMGIVHLAERVDGGFEQQVAIKLMRSAPFPADALALFASERRMLARLHHPHIAQLLDGGVTDDGLSYIVMERIDGAPITDHADAAGLDIRARIALFLETCAAVEAAHRNLVVHADIKPNNVIVAEEFGVKLLDFGIARLIGDGTSGPSALTPGYASPARRAGQPFTVSDDIFSLGVLLDALIEGRADGDRDLAAITAKARANDPEVRYATVHALGDDLRRWLDHRPVAANPPVPRRRLYLAWRRNRAGWSAAALVGLALIATTIVTSVQYVRAARARATAEARFAETRSLSRYLIDDVTAALAPLPASGPVRQRIATRANAALEQLSRVPGASRDLRIESARAYTTVGNILIGGGVSEGAGATRGAVALRHAELMLRTLLDEEPARPDLNLALAEALIGRARHRFIAGGETVGALRLLDEAVRRIDALPPALRGGERAVTARWDADLARAGALDQQGEFARLLPLARTIVARYPSKEGQRGADRALRIERGLTLLADAQYFTGDLAGTVVSYRRALAALADPAFATDVRVIIRKGLLAFNLASTLAELGQSGEALDIIRHARDEIALLARFDASPSVVHVRAIVTMEYAVELAAARRFDQAIGIAQESVAQRRAGAALQPDSYEALRTLPVGLRPLGEIYRKAGREAEACRTFAATDAAWEAIARKLPLSRFDREQERVTVAKAREKCRAR